MYKYTIFIIFLLCFKLSESTLGVDISQESTITNFQCLSENGYKFAIIRCSRSNGLLDVNCPHSIYNAWAGGMQYVDIYIFPCYRCGDGYGQMQNMTSFVEGYEAKYGMVWIDIELPQYWSNDTELNRDFFNDMVKGGNDLGLKMGVYSSLSQWNRIFGADFEGGSQFPLWYAHYDNQPNFNDFREFGGWTKPALKQYLGDVTVCGIGLDKNWYP
eukprot:gene7377-9061_t